MEYIPVLYLPSTYQKQGVSLVTLKERMKTHAFTSLYIVDEMGITKNKPHYEFYQRVSPFYDLWVDTGPREIGDVVDDVFSGAKTIIIRYNLWREQSFSCIREMTSHDIYLALHIKDIQKENERQHLIDDADGIVLFITEQHRMSFIDESEINKLIKKKPMYIFDSMDNEQKWKTKEINGLLHDINNYM